MTDLTTATPDIAGMFGPRMLTPTQLAEMLGVTTKTLERWRMTGDGPAFIRVSRKVIRYRHLDVEAFLAGRVTTSTASDSQFR